MALKKGSAISKKKKLRGKMPTNNTGYLKTTCQRKNNSINYSVSSVKRKIKKKKSITAHKPEGKNLSGKTED